MRARAPVAPGVHVVEPLDPWEEQRLGDAREAQAAQLRGRGQVEELPPADAMLEEDRRDLLPAERVWGMLV